MNSRFVRKAANIQDRSRVLTICQHFVESTIKSEFNWQNIWDISIYRLHFRTVDSCVWSCYHCDATKYTLVARS